MADAGSRCLDADSLLILIEEKGERAWRARAARPTVRLRIVPSKAARSRSLPRGQPVAVDKRAAGKPRGCTNSASRSRGPGEPLAMEGQGGGMVIALAEGTAQEPRQGA